MYDVVEFLTGRKQLMSERKKLLTEFIEKMIGEKVYGITFRSGLNNYLICNLRLSKEERVVAFTQNGRQFFDGCNHHIVESLKVRFDAETIYYRFKSDLQNCEHKFKEYGYW